MPCGSGQEPAPKGCAPHSRVMPAPICLPAEPKVPPALHDETGASKAWHRSGAILKNVEVTGAEPGGKIGSPGWARTSDFLINSQALYQLSYRGTSKSYRSFTGTCDSARPARGRGSPPVARGLCVGSRRLAS